LYRMGECDLQWGTSGMEWNSSGPVDVWGWRQVCNIHIPSPGLVKDTCKRSCNLCNTAYISSPGRCKWNKFRQYTDHGMGEWSDRACESRCSSTPICSGYSLAINGENVCNIYSTVGAAGDGNTEHTCYEKTSITYFNNTSIISGPNGYVTLDKSFQTIFSNEWGRGFKCYGASGINIINEYDDAVDYCTTHRECLGFIDVGCDRKGPFVICSQTYTEELVIETCLIAKIDRIYNSLYNPNIQDHLCEDDSQCPTYLPTCHKASEKPYGQALYNGICIENNTNRNFGNQK